MKTTIDKKRKEPYEWPTSKKKRTWKNRLHEDGYGDHNEGDLEVLRMYLNRNYGYYNMPEEGDDGRKMKNKNKGP